MYLACCERGRPWISFSASRSAHCGDLARDHKSPRSVRSSRCADSRSCIVTFNHKIFSLAERMKHRKSPRHRRCNRPKQFSFIFIRQNKPRSVSRVWAFLLRVMFTAVCVKFEECAQTAWSEAACWCRPWRQLAHCVSANNSTVFNSFFLSLLFCRS